LVWDGRRWARSDGEVKVMQAAKETIRDLYRQASLIDDGDRRERLVKHARRSERLERKCSPSHVGPLRIERG
jgi:hypothetical protein